MEFFQDETDAGHENAFKRGKTVPEGAVNLAYIKAPSLSPEDNIVILDTSEAAAENVISNAGNSQNIYYANGLGILEDINGNQIIQDEYPVISNIFLADDTRHDFANFTADEMLSFCHVSRYFHLDFGSLVPDNVLTTYTGSGIKILDNQGRDYVDEHGNKLYKIQIIQPQITKATNLQAAYRIHAFVNVEDNEGLFLQYDKVELDDHGNFLNQVIGYQELLNPQPYYTYVPEETDVIDPANRTQYWYSTKPIAQKQEALGLPTSSMNGYKVFVPEKAIPDPRIFQLFRWRLNCIFNNDFEIDQEFGQSTINCGVVVTNGNPNSMVPYALLNLQESIFNRKNIKLSNPLWVAGGGTESAAAQQQFSYWSVNFDTITNAQLGLFDMLIWSPNAQEFDFSPYVGQIDYFTRVLGGTLFVDLNNFVIPTGLNINVTTPVYYATGRATNDAVPLGSGTVYSSTMATSGAPTYFDSTLGGFNLNAADVDSLSYHQQLVSQGQINYLSYAAGFDDLVVAQDSSFVPNVEIIETINQISSYTSFATATSTTIDVAPPVIPGDGIYLKTEVRAMATWTDGTEQVMNLHLPDVITQYSGTNSVDTGYITSFAPSGDFVASISQNLGSITDGGISITVYYVVQTGITHNNPNPGITHTVTVKKDTDKGKLVVSTAGHLYTCSALFSDTSQTLVDPNNGSTPSSNINYLRYINSPFVSGAMKFLYNLLMVSTQNKVLRNFEQITTFASSWQVSSNWMTSWVINPANGVMSDDEIAEFGFIYLPEDVATPIPVWQRKLNDMTCKELIDQVLTPDMQQKVQGAVRTYELEVTNVNVSTPTTLSDDSFAYAWTTAYTPSFIIPPELKSYIIKDELAKGNYSAEQYIYRTYPAKPYAGRVKISYIDTTTTTTTVVNPVPIKFTVVGNALENTTINQQNSPKDTTTTSNVQINWANAGFGTRVSNQNPYKGATVPNGIWMRFWETPAQHDGPSLANSWPYIGMTGRYQIGSPSGDAVKFIQDAVNRFTGSRLPVDGVFGPNTAAAVRQFQIEMGAKFIDGVVDAETWSLIGGQILRYGIPGGKSGFNQFYGYPYIHMAPANISNGTITNHFSKRSWVTGGPPSIWEQFWLTFDQLYKINKVSITPFLEGAANTMILQNVDIWNGFTLVAHLTPNATIKHMVQYDLPVGPYMGTTVIFTVVQNTPAGGAFGSAKYIGIADISATAAITSTQHIPGGSTVVTQNTPVSIKTEQQTIVFTSPNAINGPSVYFDVTRNPQIHIDQFSPHDPPAVSNIWWTDLVIQTGIGVKGVLDEFPNMPVYYGADGLLYDNVTNALAFYGPNGEPGQSWTPPTTPPPWVGRALDPQFDDSWQMPDGRWCEYTYQDYRYPGGIRPANTPDGTFFGNGTIFNGGIYTIAPTALVDSQNFYTVDNTYTSSHVAYGSPIGVVPPLTSIPGATPSIDDAERFPIWYSKNEAGQVNPMPEVGWVSKPDGLKILCNADGSPYGFNMPQVASPATNTQRQYLNYGLDIYTTDPTVAIGFWDDNVKEFIVTPNNTMSYSEYVSRGPQNVFVATLTTYEYDNTLPIPLDNTGAIIPTKWAMPVYGVYQRIGSKISLQPIPANLTGQDLWPVAIRPGKFFKSIALRPIFAGALPNALSGPLTDYLNVYQAVGQSTISAYYSIPEANMGGWSRLFGPPNADVIDEQPIILDDNRIQVRQPPILMVLQPTQNPSLADPVRPIFTISQKTSPNANWQMLTLADIKDYNVSSGEIILKKPMLYDDPSLFKVSYTTMRRNYYFKGFDLNDELNLNPYLGSSRDLIGQPIYIYVLPEYVVDYRGNVIPASVQTRTIRFTLNPNVFDPSAPDYDPLALELGVIYISPSASLSDLIIIDSRRRGGGVRDSITREEAVMLADEAASYWDINYGSGSSYQKGGFVVIKLPASIHKDFSDDEIRTVIERNLTAGVQYVIEDMIIERSQTTYVDALLIQGV